MPSSSQHGAADSTSAPIVFDVIEVPLSGPNGHAASDELGDGPNWRRAIGIAVALGSALGIAGGLLLADNNNDEPEDSGPTATTLPADELSALITTPPTLQSLDTLPSTELSRDTAPVATAAQPVTGDLDLLDRAPLPEFAGIQPGFPGIQPGSGEVFRFDLDEAVSRFTDAAAATSFTTIDHPELGFEMTAATTFNPISERFQLDIEFNEVTTTLIVDLPSAVAYIVRADGSIEVVDPADLLSDVAVETVEDLFDALLYGPVRPATLESATTRGKGLYNSAEFGALRQFTVTIDSTELPVWFPYLLGPGRVGAVGGDAPIEYRAYVDRSGNLRRIDGVTDVEGSVERISHIVTLLDELPTIELPVAEAAPAAAETTQPSSS